MGKMVNQLLNYNTEVERPTFYDNFRRTYSGQREPSFAARPAGANQRGNINSNLPVRITRLRRGPRWIANN